MAFVCIVCILASRIMHNSLYNMMCILSSTTTRELYSKRVFLYYHHESNHAYTVYVRSTLSTSSYAYELVVDTLVGGDSINNTS